MVIASSYVPPALATSPRAWCIASLRRSPAHTTTMAASTQEATKPIGWLPLESNPEVLNPFLWKLGVPGEWGFCDVFGLDPELLAMVPRPCMALCLLFPCAKIACSAYGRQPRLSRRARWMK